MRVERWFSFVDLSGFTSFGDEFGDEEWLLVLAGTPTLRTPDGERVLRAWDVAAFVRGEAGAHEVRNDTEEPARVAMLSTAADPDVCVYPASVRRRLRSSSVKRARNGSTDVAASHASSAITTWEATPSRRRRPFSMACDCAKRPSYNRSSGGR